MSTYDLDSLFVQKEKSSTVDYIIDEIKKLLISKKLKPGDKMPSEIEIAEGLGVSRGSVRSAMVVFKSFGIIDIKPGDGTYICKSLNKNAMDSMVFSLLILNPNIDELVKFREKIELDMLELIINDKDSLESTLCEMESNLNQLQLLQDSPNATTEDYAENDKEFHRIFVNNCKNVVFNTVYKYVFEFFYPYIRDAHARQVCGVHSAEEHRNIYEALKVKNYAELKKSIINSMKVWYNLVNY